MLTRHRTASIKGYRLKRPHITWVGYAYILVPIFGLLLLLDWLLYLIFHHLFNQCYGILCLP